MAYSVLKLHNENAIKPFPLDQSTLSSTQKIDYTKQVAAEHGTLAPTHKNEQINRNLFTTLGWE